MRSQLMRLPEDAYVCGEPAVDGYEGESGENPMPPTPMCAIHWDAWKEGGSGTASDAMWEKYFPELVRDER